jgi:very-short-patch-repair endonuclease
LRGHNRNSKSIQRARRLRSNSTEVEKSLWATLRGRRFLKFKFRRQHPVGRYVVDFVCISRKLIVELDGGQHALRQNQDRLRTRNLESEGFRVIRFWNNDVNANLEGVLTMILGALESRT